MKKLLLYIAVVTAASSANATVYVPDGSTSGTQGFTYAFTGDYIGTLNVGVSNQGDDAVESYMDLSSFGGLLAGTADMALNTSANEDTSAYLNTLGESGTYGQISSFSISALAGDVLSFSWVFGTDDYDPYNDFSFVELTGQYYEVLAEVAAPVSAPSTFVVFALGLLGLGYSRKHKAC